MPIDTPQTDSTSGTRLVAARHVTGRRQANGVIVLLTAGLALMAIAPLTLPDRYSYSWIEQPTSESAAQGLDGAWVARLGFVALGLAVLRLTSLRAPAWRAPATSCHLAFGIGMLGGAVFSTKPWWDGAAFVGSEDLLHSACAGMVGLGFVTGVLAVIAGRPPDSRRSRFDLTVIAVVTCLALLWWVGIWGVLQRSMFLTAAIWYGHQAWMLRPTRRRGHG